MLRYIIPILCISLSLFSKNVLITGATGGIGMASVKAFQEKGWKVWGGTRKEISDEMKQMANVRWVHLDITNERAIADAVAKILQEDGKIDALINNAGFGLLGTEDCITMDEARNQFEVNFFGPFRLIQALLPSMKQQQSGHIINVSSISGIRALPGLGMYGASKFALEGLSESMAVTLSPWNIKIALVEPGAVKNDFILSLKIATPHEPFQETFTSNFIKRLSALAVNAQECSEIAHIILEIAENPNPDMRVQTSKQAKDVAAKKLSDLTGNVMRDLQMQFFQSLLD